MKEKHKSVIKYLVISIIMIVVAFEATYFYVNSLVRPESYKQQVLDVIKAKTGLNVTLDGEVGFSLLPAPRLVVSGLAVDSNSADADVPKFTIEKLEVYIDFSTLTAKQIKLTSVSLISPVLSLERAKDGAIHWAWLNSKLLKSLNSKNGDAPSLPIAIKNGAFFYNDAKNNKNIKIENINAGMVAGVLTGGLQIADRGFSFSIDNNVAPDSNLNELQFPLNFTLSDGAASLLKIEGAVDSSGEYSKIVGKFNAETDDLFKWVPSSEEVRRGERQQSQSSAFSVAGQWSFDSGVFSATDMLIKGLGSQGKGEAGVEWRNWYPTISLNLDFEYLDYLQWQELLLSGFKEEKKKDDGSEDDNRGGFDFRKKNPLPENIEVALNIDAEKIIYGKEEWRPTHLNAVLDKGSFVVNQCDIILDGDGVVSVFGVISQGGTGDLRFEGNMEAKGKSFVKSLSMFYSAASDLPIVGEKDFAIKANMYVNSEQVRLFEAESSIGGMPVGGTMVVHFGYRPRIETKLKLKDLNFDIIRDNLRKSMQEKSEEKKDEQKTADGKQVNAGKEGKTSFDWLRYLPVRIDAGVMVDGFTFMERSGNKASFSLYAYGGDLRISGLQFSYPDALNEFNCNLDVRGKLPFINLTANADRFDASYISLQNKKSETEKDAVESAFALQWMDDFNGVFDITLQKLLYKDVVVEKIKFQGKLENKMLNVQRFNFVYSQAQSSFLGVLYGGRVPGVSGSFTMANADIYELLQRFLGLKNIYGYASLSGALSTSGNSFKEWMRHLESKVLIAARGVKVQGVNLAGVTNAVEIARSSADVFNNVNNVLTDGMSDFSVDGSFNVKDGELRAPGFNLTSGFISGNLVGGVKLDTFESQFSSTLRFANLSPDPVPFLIVQMSGNLHKPNLKVDTASLEDFVAKRNVSR